MLSSAEFTRSAGLGKVYIRMLRVRTPKIANYTLCKHTLAGSVRFADRVKRLGTRVEMPRSKGPLRFRAQTNLPVSRHLPHPNVNCKGRTFRRLCTCKQGLQRAKAKDQ